MNLFQISKAAALLALCTILGACTNSSITQVRESSLPQSNFTFGEVFDGAKGCMSTDWDHSKADYGQTLVEFTCLISTSDDVVQAAKQQALQDLDRVAQEKEERYSNMLAAAEAYLASSKNSAQLSEQSRSAKLEEAARGLQAAEAQATEIANSPINNPTWKRMAEQALTQRKISTAELQSKLEAERSSEQAHDQELIAKAQKRLEEMAQWKEQYLAAVKVTRDKVPGDLETHFSGSHKFQLKVTFLAHETRGVSVNSSEWFLDKKKVASNAFIPAFLRHPKDMDTALKDTFQDKIRFGSGESFGKQFPIECVNDWGDLVTGCALKS